MNSVKLMMDEHQYILRMAKVMRRACYRLLQDGSVDYADFNDMMDFIKNYADAHHHGKEEKIMFQKMQDQLGRMAQNLITHGMLVEHDLGRFHMQELRAALERLKAGDDESKLDVIANAITYTHLIERHIKKEDDLVYPYGEKNLTEEDMNQINQMTDDFEQQATTEGTQSKYVTLLENLEMKYL